MTSPMRLFTALTGIAVLAGVAAAQGTRSVWDGIYTETQAKRGEALFDRECAGCHGPEGAGGSMAPALVGATFSANYDGQMVGDLFDRNRTTMPVGKEGALGGPQIADITAYMLQVNHFPAGAAELPSQSMPLKVVKYLAEKPADKQPASSVQSPRTARSDAMLLDSRGETKAARAIFQRLVDEASDPAARAAAERAMAMSFAFDGDCANTIAYEERVIAYWKTRESAEPQNAFYQEGEMANEAARVCIDAGDLEAAARWYRTGTELGLKEPEPKTHPASLWEFRLAHALGRLAARREDKAEAARQIANARRALDSDAAMAVDQKRFLPYLIGYVAYYADDLGVAEAALTEATASAGNTNDPFMRCLLAMTDEKLGRSDRARAEYEKAYAMATAHNPPSAFVRRFVRAKIGLADRTNR